MLDGGLIIPLMKPCWTFNHSGAQANGRKFTLPCRLPSRSYQTTLPPSSFARAFAVSIAYC